MLELLDTPHLKLRCDYRRHIVVLTRTGVPFERLLDLRTSFQRVERALASVPRGRFRILFDTREAPSRNDAPFEDAFEPIRRQLFAGFGRGAILVRTALGKLQAKRYAVEDELGVEVFTREDEALEFLHVETPRPYA